MVHWTEAVQAAGSGVRLLVEVTASCKEARFPDAFNAWREGRIGVRVRAAAEQGRANEEAVRAVAGFFGVPAGTVRIDAGMHDSRKALLVAGLQREAAVRRLATVLGAP